MPIREPIRYELSPRKLDVGEQWLTLTLENVSDDEMTSVSVNLNTTNFVDLEVLGTGEFVPAMRPEEEVILTFKVRAQRTTDVYVILDGLKDGDPFYWESPYITIDIGAPIAEITSLFVLSEPYPYLTKDLKAECTVFGNEAATGLTVHFWVDTPSGHGVTRIISPPRLTTRSDAYRPLLACQKSMSAGCELVITMSARLEKPTCHMARAKSTPLR